MKTTDSRKTRVRLTRERIIDAAIEIARQRGAQSVTMGNVSKSLGTTAMALYRHVNNRDDLVQSMLDRAARELSIPPLSEDPVQEILHTTCAVYDTLRLEPWVVHHLLEGYRGGAGVFALGNRTMNALNALGLDREDVFHAYCALTHYTYGEILAIQAFQLMNVRYQEGLEPMNDDEVAVREFERLAAVHDPRTYFTTTIRRYILGIVKDNRDAKTLSSM